MITRPLNGYVFLRRDPAASERESGIVIPEHSKGEKPRFGTVVAAGDTASVTPGERCLIDFDRAHPVRYMGEQLAAVKDTDILAVLDQPEGKPGWT